MRTLSLGESLALYIDRDDLDRLGLAPTTQNIASLARRALAERGSPGGADLTLEIYPGADGRGDLLVFCLPLERETISFCTLALAICAAKRLTASRPGSPVHSALYRSDEGEWLLELRASPRVLRFLRAEASEFGTSVRADPDYLAEHASAPIPYGALARLAEL